MRTETAKSKNRLAAAIATGLSSARENALPGLFLWVFASLIVGAYFLFEPVTQAFNALGRFKLRWGFLYSAISTAIFGGLIPSSISLLMNRGRGLKLWPVASWKAIAFLSLFWAWKGVEVDALYRMQALVFGLGVDVRTIFFKVLVDMFLYNPLLAGWTQIVCYWFLEKAFRPAPGEGRLFLAGLGPRLLTTLISTWGIWLPMVSLIYSMPASLQIPLFNIVLCFWGLMLASLSIRAQGKVKA